MYDAGKVIIGILVFVALLLFPIWYNVAKGSAAGQPELAKPVKGTTCVLETEYMRSTHMDLLNEWRDLVVRDGERDFSDQHGTVHEMSLNRTCLDCHADKAAFCDRCHDYMGVKPYCWDCHVVPGEVTDGSR